MTIGPRIWRTSESGGHGMWKPWTDAELAAAQSDQTAERIAQQTGRTVDAVRRRRAMLAKEDKRPRRTSPDWTAEEIALLGQMTNAQVAKATGRTVPAVQSKRAKLRRKGIL